MSSRRMKYASLAFLSVQTASHVLFLRYSRSSNRDNPYLPSTTVALQELFKIIINLVAHFCEKDFSLTSTARSINNEVFLKPRETFKLLVPAGLYVVQNSLLFVALTNLDSATYQVCYQMKILTTALFAVLMLSKRLRLTQWLSLLILTAGVAMVQVVKTDSVAAKSVPDGSPMIGLMTVVVASCLSGFNGVYFEKVLKGSSQSLWIRNIQLSVFSVIIAFGSVFINDGAAVAEKGFFQGYTYATWAVITLGVLSGITVALVVKYADNILKGFAVSISILISSFVSYYFLNDFEPSLGFVVGSSMVMLATFMYGVDFSKKPSMKQS